MRDRREKLPLKRPFQATSPTYCTNRASLVEGSTRVSQGQAEVDEIKSQFGPGER